jgi:hypothetical protein
MKAAEKAVKVSCKTCGLYTSRESSHIVNDDISTAFCLVIYSMAFRLPFPPVGEQRKLGSGEAGAGQRQPPPGMEFLNGIFTRGFLA